jgi:hypothetical protein
MDGEVIGFRSDFIAIGLLPLLHAAALSQRHISIWV